MEEDLKDNQEELSKDYENDMYDAVSTCNHWHSEATNSCSGRCMLREGHFTNHGCAICHGQW